MDLFNELILELQLVDVPLKNRAYTWCNKRPRPVFSKIDRCFISPEWSTIYPVITLQANEMIISDHVPLILTLKHSHHVKRQPKIELFWMRDSEMNQAVSKLWGPHSGTNSIHIPFSHKIFTLQAREILSHVHKTKRQSVFVKIDFSKAFDTVNWKFLQQVLLQRGFPMRWVQWVMALLDTASSRVLVNGQPSEFFMHKMGLRQGDPLSPMLFLLAVDVLQKFIEVANSTLTTPISPKIPKSIIAL